MFLLDSFKYVSCSTKWLGWWSQWRAYFSAGLKPSYSSINIKCCQNDMGNLLEMQIMFLIRKAIFSSYIYVTFRSDKQKVMDYMKNGETSKMDPTYTPSICSIFSKSPMEMGWSEVDTPCHGCPKFPYHHMCRRRKCKFNIRIKWIFMGIPHFDTHPHHIVGYIWLYNYISHYILIFSRFFLQVMAAGSSPYCWLYLFYRWFHPIRCVAYSLNLPWKKWIHDEIPIYT